MQPDIRWCRGLLEPVKVYTVTEAAGIITTSYLGAWIPFGQHFALAMPESLVANYCLGADPGISLEEAYSIPGMSMPKDGYVVPSDAPDFGMEIAEGWVEAWDLTAAISLRQKGY